MLAQMKQKYGDRVVFLSLTVEEEDTPERIAEKFATARELHFARASGPARAELLRMGGQENVLPTSVFINALGDVVLAIVGDDGFEEGVQRILP